MATQAALALDPKASPEELADQIVALPDGTNLGAAAGSLVKALLTSKKPEERDPLKYAEVFDIVADSPKATDWMHVAAMVESVNGRRRAKGADMPAIAMQLERIEAMAKNLPDSPERNGLMGTILYNTAIVCRGLRRYADAAAAQRKSSALHGFADDTEKQYVAIFAAEVEEASEAFMSGNSDAIRRDCRALIAARDLVKAAFDPYPTWMVENASLHIGWALMMGNLIGAVADGDLRDYESDFVAGEQSGSEAWQKVFNAWRDYKEGNFDDVIAMVPTDTHSSSLDNTKLTLKILAALARRAEEEMVEANAMLQQVADHSGPDGGIPIAVARKLLAG